MTDITPMLNPEIIWPVDPRTADGARSAAADLRMSFLGMACEANGLAGFGDDGEMWFQPPADEIVANSPDRRELAEARDMLAHCASVFREYAGYHLAKGTSEATIKAARNVELAMCCEDHLPADWRVHPPGSSIPPGGDPRPAIAVTYTVRDRAGMIRYQGAPLERAQSVISRLSDDAAAAPLTLERVTHVAFKHREVISQ